MTEKETGNSEPIILVVDDNPLILNVLQGLFLSQGYTVHASENGKEARKILEENPVDVVVCDVMMPEMGGYDLHDFVRSQPGLSHVSFVFLTALDSPGDVRIGKESGVDDYVTKPFVPEELLAVVGGKIKRSRQMQQSNRESYDRYRRQLVQTLSHEFRTPLVAINTGTELLLNKDKPAEPEQGRHIKLLEAIHRGGQRLERLVNDFVLFQQIEGGVTEKLHHANAAVRELREVVRECLEDNDELSGFTVEYEFDDAEIQVHLYEPQIKDAVLRLLGNAVKFSEGQKTILVSCLCSDDRAFIKVRDFGTGMSAVEAKLALEPFTQIDRDRREQQGSGLGLAIVKHYTELNGGELSLTSPEGGGLLATLSFPLSKE